MTIKDKVAIITGASSGKGLATVKPNRSGVANSRLRFTYGESLLSIRFIMPPPRLIQRFVDSRMVAIL